MEHETPDGTLDLDLKCIEMFGIAWDFFNEVPTDAESTSSIDFFIDKCKKGWVRTYTQRFQNSPKILEKSDHKKVEDIDLLMTEAIEAARVDDRETVKTRIREILTFRK